MPYHGRISLQFAQMVWLSEVYGRVYCRAYNKFARQSPTVGAQNNYQHYCEGSLLYEL